MKYLHQLIDQLESRIPEYEIVDLDVSNGSVGWHIEHSLKTIHEIVLACKTSNPNEYKWNFNLKRLIILDVINKIPRGKVKAPKLVRPEGEITENSLKLSLKNLRTNLVNWDQLNKSAYFKHPFFDDLNKTATEKFLILHTNHHLKIINDILKAY